MWLWVDGAHDPAEHMRRDAALLAAADRGAEPVLRLFRFEPFGITLGLGQRPERELDLGRCRAEGVPWAVRPTGGRAIFHAQEWTYSLAAPLGDPDWGGSSAEAYRKTSERIAASLRRLGVPARFAGSASGSERGPRGLGEVAAPCFASTARHEIVLEDGRKLVGSAQRRTANGLLQQGSVLLGEGHLRLADLLAIPAERREGVRRSLALATGHAGRWLAGLSLERWADALAAERPTDVRRRSGASGAFLLTLRNGHAYARSLSQDVNGRAPGGTSACSESVG